MRRNTGLEGGGMFFKSRTNFLSIRDSEFSNNSANIGGALHFYKYSLVEFENTITI